MATLEEILQLDKIQSSIKKIDLFVSQKTKYSREYMLAIAYKGLVLHALGKTNDALKLLYEYIPDIQKIDSESAISLCSSIIEITIDAKVFEQASKYIRLKQTYLPVSRASEYIKDTTRLYLAKHDYENAKDALLRYLDDDITSDEEIYALENLSMIYYQERDYDKYLECIPKLESYYTSILDLAHQEEIGKNRIEIAYIKKNPVEVIMKGSEYLKEYDNNARYSLKVASYVINSYIYVSDYKKASIVESNYEEYISSDYLEESIDFCNAAIDLYNHTGTSSSVIEYRRRLEELEKKKNEAPEKKEKRKPKKEAEIIIPEVETSQIVLPKSTDSLSDFTYNPISVLNPTIPEPEVITQRVVEDIKAVKSIQVSENYTNLEAVFDSMNDVKLHSKFRDCFRLCCIEITKQYPIDEIYLLYFQGKYLGLHYKKERAYDKKPTIEALEGTLGFEAMEHNLEQFLDQSDTTYNKDIVTGKEYPEDITALALPLVDSITCIGSITYISSKPFIALELCYESLKLITKALNTRLLVSIEQTENELKEQKTNFIRNSMSSGVKENMEGYYHFSSRAIEILGVMETLAEQDYLMHLSSVDAASYKRVLNELYELQTMDLSLEYDFNKNGEQIRVRERFYPLLMDGMICIFSLLDDITREYRDRENLIALAYKNPLSNMETQVKLTADLVQEFNTRKISLAIIDVVDSALYKEIYGRNFYNQVIKAVGMKLTKAFENDFHTELYHMEGTTYAVLFREVNDRRVIDSRLKEALGQAVHEMEALNHRVKICFNAGVYRLSKNSNLKDPSDIIFCANDALIDAQAMEGKVNHIAHFDSDSNRRRFRENSIVTEISEALDFGRLSVMYKQIVDLAQTSVFGFWLSLNMDNYEIEEEEMQRVVRRKGLTTQMEKYMISTTFKEEKLFHDTFRAFLNVFIPVSRETTEEKFLEFLQSQQSFFKMDPKYVTFIADSIHGTTLEKLKGTGYHLASRDIFDVYRGLCDYLIYDYHGVSKESIPEILELCKKHSVICILAGMNTKEDIEMSRGLGYRYIYGDFYKVRKRIKDIIESNR